MPRSVCIHPDHKDTIALALERNGFLTQGDLAANLMIALSTVSRFFRGIRVSIASFEQICEALGLEPREVMRSPSVEARTVETQSSGIQNIPVANTTQFFAYDPFWVGRTALIDTLTERLNNNCRLLLLTGLSGIGKTGRGLKTADFR